MKAPKNDYIHVRCTRAVKETALRSAKVVTDGDLTEYVERLIVEDSKRIAKRMKKMSGKYFIDYNTGAGNDEADTLEEAMKMVEEDVTYTGQDVSIYRNGTLVANLPWWGVSAGDDDVVTVDFGSFGYYGEWVIY